MVLLRNDSRRQKLPLEVYTHQFLWKYCILYISPLCIWPEWLSSVKVNCRGDYTCDFADIYCQATEQCSIYCEKDANSTCGLVPEAVLEVYLFDPDNLYDDSLLSISCESGDCDVQHYFCGNNSYIPQCAISRLTTPLTCNATDSHCNVCSLSFRM